MTWIDTDGRGARVPPRPGLRVRGQRGRRPAAPPDAVRDGALLLSSDPLEPDGWLPGTTSAWYAV